MQPCWSEVKLGVDIEQIDQSVEQWAGCTQYIIKTVKRTQRNSNVNQLCSLWVVSLTVCIKDAGSFQLPNLHSTNKPWTVHGESFNISACKIQHVVSAVIIYSYLLDDRWMMFLTEWCWYCFLTSPFFKATCSAILKCNPEWIDSILWTEEIWITHDHTITPVRRMSEASPWHDNCGLSVTLSFRLSSIYFLNGF